MTEAQVRAAEAKPAHDLKRNGNELVLRYDSISVAGLDAHVVYIFAAGKLIRAKYVFDKAHSESLSEIDQRKSWK
jgi:hypothetical protein